MPRRNIDPLALATLEIKEEPYEVVAPFSSRAAKARVHAKPSADTSWYVARLHGKIVGFKGIMWKRNGTARFKGFYVFEEYQGMGIGERIIEYVEAQVEARGCSMVENFTYNRPRFEKRGYRYTRSLPNGAAVMIKVF
jgi:GNAT superfamily N-acetyltransferase